MIFFAFIPETSVRWQTGSGTAKRCLVSQATQIWLYILEVVMAEISFSRGQDVIHSSSFQFVFC